EVLAGTADVGAVFGALVDHLLAQDGGSAGQAGGPVDDVHDEVEAVHIVEDQHVEWRGGGAFLFEPADVEVGVSGAAVGEAVDEPRVAVVGEHDRAVGGEDGVELGVGQAVRVFGGGLQAHQVDDVDDPDLEVGQVPVEQVGGGEDLQGGHVAGGREDDVGVAGVVGGPVPDAQPAGA